MFEIVDGGFNDIDIKISDPDGKVIHEAERESSGKYTFGASTAGAYTWVWEQVFFSGESVFWHVIFLIPDTVSSINRELWPQKR